MARICQTRRRLSRCRAAAEGLCQYCGRAFCVLHGSRQQDGSEICVRTVCQEKHTDLAAHLNWRERAIDRSNRGFCGMEACDGERWGQCSKCHAIFCQRHLQDRDERVRSGSLVLSRPASMCDHCAARNKLWSQS